MPSIGVNLLFQCAVGSCGRTRVDVELVLVLKRFELVRVAGDEDVDVQLPLQQRQAGHVAPRDHLVAVDEADLKLAHRHHLLLRVVQVLRVRERKRGAQAVRKTPRITLVISLCSLFFLPLTLEEDGGSFCF